MIASNGGRAAFHSHVFLGEGHEEASARPGR